MKLTCCFSMVFLVTLFGLNAQTLNGFYESFHRAKEASQNEKKILMIDFYTSWCAPCKKLDKYVYGAEDFFPYTQKMACVKVDFESEEGAKLGERYNVSSFPTVVFVDPDGKEIERITSYYAKERYMKDVNRIVEGKNTIGAMEARFPDQSTYEDLFHMSIYYGRTYIQKEKRSTYYRALLKMDPEMKRDSTLMLTNVLFQFSYMMHDGSETEEALKFIMDYPAPPYQAELMLRIVKYLVASDQKVKAQEAYNSFVALLETDDKEVLKYLKEAKKVVR